MTEDIVSPSIHYFQFQCKFMRQIETFFFNVNLVTHHVRGKVMFFTGVCLFTGGGTLVQVILVQVKVPLYPPSRPPPGAESALAG